MNNYNGECLKNVAVTELEATNIKEMGEPIKETVSHSTFEKIKKGVRAFIQNTAKAFDRFDQLKNGLLELKKGLVNVNLNINIKPTIVSEQLEDEDYHNKQR